MIATFNGNPYTIIISCYSPTNVRDETNILTFYNNLSSLVHCILKYNVLIIAGGMNAQIDKDENNKKLIKQKWGTSNRYSLENKHPFIQHSRKRKENYRSTRT